MLNVTAVYAPVEVALNSEVAQAAQIIPRPSIGVVGYRRTGCIRKPFVFRHYVTNSHFQKFGFGMAR